MQGEKIAEKDLFSALLQAKDPETGQRLIQPEFISEASLLIMAGIDTTITGTTSTILYLVNHPSALACLQQEVRNAFSAIKDIRIGPQLGTCQFLTACINVSLRLTPPVDSILPREVLSGGITIDGERFLPGTDLGVPHYTLYHSEDHFPAPLNSSQTAGLLRRPHMKKERPLKAPQSTRSKVTLPSRRSVWEEHPALEST